MDWVTLTRQQVENDALPRVCMACGSPATCRVNESFSHTPDWVQWLYLAGFFPGLIADQFFTKEIRVSCPFCQKHRHHWQLLYWTAGIGWLFAGALFASIGLFVGAVFFSTSGSAHYIGLGVGAALGIVLWLAVLIYLSSTRIIATKVTAEEVTLQRVADAFAKAMKDQRPSVKP
jgi:hypothetical protein